MTSDTCDVAGRRVFLSGPMTGVRNCNVGAFVDAHAMLKEAGAAVVYDPAIEYLAQEEPAGGLPHDHYMRRCLRELVSESRVGVRAYDLLVSLPGWRESEGATTERMVAGACGIECRDLSEVV